MASRALTQMYIVMRTADATPVWGPRLYLFALTQHIRRKTARE
jgi:hypothetical protein